MWSRESIKNYAKDFLRKHYWKAFLVCLIVSLISNNNSGSNRGSRNNYINNEITNEIEVNDGIPSLVNNTIDKITFKMWRETPIFSLLRGIILPVFFLPVFFLMVIILVTVGYALEVGKARFFLSGFQEDVNIGNLFSTFNSEEYFKIMITQFIRGLYNFLWTLLLIVPGIIKFYEYRMVPYILSEEPNLPTNEVIGRSRRMTDGHKMDMFILDISFWGWYLLGSLFWGIGVFFVNPYKEATLAKLYNILSGSDDMDGDTIIES